MNIDPVPKSILASSLIEKSDAKKVKHVRFEIPQTLEESEPSETSETSEMSETSETSEVLEKLEMSDHDANPSNGSIRLVFMFELLIIAKYLKSTK